MSFWRVDHGRPTFPEPFVTKPVLPITREYRALPCLRPPKQNYYVYFAALDLIWNWNIVLVQFKLNCIKIIYCSLTSIAFEIDEAVIFSKDSLIATWTEMSFWRVDHRRPTLQEPFVTKLVVPIGTNYQIIAQAATARFPKLCNMKCEREEEWVPCSIAMSLAPLNSIAMFILQL